MPKIIEGQISAKGFKFGIAVSRFNDFITNKLLDGSLDALLRNGATDEKIEVVKVPGAFELPYAIQRMAQKKKYDAIICLGAVIRGSTPHFEYVSAEVAKGIAKIALDTGIPIANGVINADNIEQAIERAGTKMGNKGWDAAISAIEMVNLFKNI